MSGQRFPIIAIAACPTCHGHGDGCNTCAEQGWVVTEPTEPPLVYMTRRRYEQELAAATTPKSGWAALSDDNKAAWTAMVAEMNEAVRLGPPYDACTCGYPQKECLRVVLRNGPPYPPRPCEPVRRAAGVETTP